MNRPFQEATIYYNKIIPLIKTRFPWFHKNFSGLPGWKQGFIKELEVELGPKILHPGTLKVLFKFLGYPILLDSDKSACWKLPKLFNTGVSIRTGWLYWAIVIMYDKKLYHIPQSVKENYKVLSNPKTLKRAIVIGMRENDPPLVMDAMDIMLKLDYSNFRIHTRTISKTGDRIQYTITYPKTRVIIESVNGMQNHVLAAKYHHILTTRDLEDRQRYLLLKDNMTPDQLEWLQEVE